MLINFKVSKRKKAEKTMVQLDCIFQYMSVCYVVRGVNIKKSIVKIENKKLLEITVWNITGLSIVKSYRRKPKLLLGLLVLSHVTTLWMFQAYIWILCTYYSVTNVIGSFDVTCLDHWTLTYLWSKLMLGLLVLSHLTTSWMFQAYI